MRVAIFGGSFNPLHIGHAMLADVMIQDLKYDKVLFVPTNIPPHKELNSNISTQQRLEMLQAFCNSVERGVFEVEPCEIERGGISYTVDTLKYILEKYKDKLDGKPALLMGEEIAAEFDKWKEPDFIAANADIIIVPRFPDYYGIAEKFTNIPTGRYSGDLKAKFDRGNFKYPFKYLEIPVLNVSSTEIRARAASNRSYKFLVPRSVFKYIVSHNLYK